MQLLRETREAPVGFSTAEAINTTNDRLRLHPRAAPGLQGLECSAPWISGQLAAGRVRLSGRIAKLGVPAASTDGRFNQMGERWLRNGTLRNALSVNMCQRRVEQWPPVK